MILLVYRILQKLSRFAGISSSFASDGEDYILLKYLRGIENGNYIDIGSHKPIKHSATFCLYLLGWRGICVDPIPYLKNNYRILRGKDLFINAGVSGGIKEREQKEMTFYYYKNNPDNSSFDKESVDNLIELYGRYPSTTYSVPVISVARLINMYRKHYRSDGLIHVLNLDTEGGELHILQDLFEEECFPWFICVEELGYVADNISDSRINKYVGSHGYILVAKTFLSSIYMRTGVQKYLKSQFVKGLNI